MSDALYGSIVKPHIVGMEFNNFILKNYVQTNKWQIVPGLAH